MRLKADRRVWPKSPQRMSVDHLYLEAVPEGFGCGCDMLLELDDGSELRAHSQILARYSSVFADMLFHGPLYRASHLEKVSLPLTDCSRATAISLMTMLYSGLFQPIHHITDNYSMQIAGLAHKLNIKVVFSSRYVVMQGLTIHNCGCSLMFSAGSCSTL